MEETLNIESPEFTMPGIVFTDAAARKVQELVLEEGNPDLKLRVYISGGGCSGFQYGFTFDEEVEDGDSQVVNHLNSKNPFTGEQIAEPGRIVYVNLGYSF